MSTVVKDLGPVTAYAYAVAGGYTGTEEEFTELLGDLAATVADLESLTVTVTTLTPGSSATASYEDGVLALGIPQGAKGDTGTAATIAVGTVTTVAPTQNASATNTGSSSAAVFAFSIPRGDGVATVTKTGTSGNVDTYTMTSDRGVTLGTFTVTNGNVSSVNGKTGAVVLDAGDLGYDGSETYSGGTVGAEVSQLKSQIDDIKGGKTPIDFTLVANEYVVNTTGAFAPYNNWSRTDYIPVTPGTKIYYYCTAATNYNCWYDSDKQKTGSSFAMQKNTGTLTSVTVPDGAAYMCLSNRTTDMNDLLLWTAPAVINDKTATDYSTYSGNKINSLIADPPLIFTPSAIYVTEGSEVSLYFDNIMLGGSGKYYITAQINGITWTDEFSERFSMRPEAGDHGDYTIAFRLRDKKTAELLASKDIPVHVLENSTITGKKALFIGDSLTAAGYFSYEIQNNISSGGVTSLGTLTAHPYFNDVAVDVNHEGRGGWSAHDYVTQASKGTATNAFWNPSTSKFDFSYYLSNNSISTPDIVFICLGTNGVENATDEVSAITEMITSIHTVSSSLPVVVNLITPPATQDGWTYVTHGGSVDRFKRLQLLLNDAFMTAFDGKTAQHIYVAPSYINIDREHDFPYEEVACSSRNPYLVYRQKDNVHLANYGYFKMADVFWAMIQKILG